MISLYYDQQTAEKAEEHFNTVVVGKGIPDEMPVYKLDSKDLIVNVIFSSGLLKSKGEARRMLKQGAVKLNDNRIDDINATVMDFKKIGDIVSTETLMEMEVDLGW